MSTERSWRRALLASGSPVRDAIRCLDDSALRIVLVVDEAETLVGTITDGDIRRGLLRGLDLDSSIETIINADPIVVTGDFDRRLVVQLMRANRIQQVPIVDEDRRVQGLHVFDELTSPRARENTIVIMAGGLGSRLRPHTEDCPKPLLDVAGKPILERIIEHASTQGFQKFVIAVHYLGHMIEEYFGDGSGFGVNIEYLREQTPLGTAGALALLERTSSAPLIVSNGDVLTDIRFDDLLDFHQRHGSRATMAVRLHEWQHPFGGVRLVGLHSVGFEEKPVAQSHINAGVYALEPEVIGLMNHGQVYDMPALFELARSSGLSTLAYPMHEPWLDLGRPEDLEKVREDLKS